MKKIFYSLAVITLLASCSATRKAAKPPVITDATPPAATEAPAAEETISTVLEKMNHFGYNTFAGRTAVDFTDGKGKTTSVNAKINIKKDELVWASITGPLGIEGARALITKDSVKIINKLNKTYIANSIDYLQDKLGLPLSLQSVQDLLVGNPVFIDKGNSSYTKTGESIVLTSQTKQFINLLTLLVPGYLPVKSELKDVDAAKNRTASLTYEDYKAVNNFNFPTKRNIEVNYKNKTSIKLDFETYTFNQEISTPFSIPSNYKKSL